MLPTHKFFPVVLIALVACGGEDEKSQEAPLESFRNEVTATQVRVGIAEQKSFDYLINASGKIEARSQVMAVIERSGYLVELEVQEGQNIRAGDIIGRLDNTDHQFELEKAKVQYRTAEAEYTNQRIGFQSILTQNDTARTRLLEDQLKASSGLFSAEIALKEAEINIAKAIIKAPVSGKIADVKLKKGSLVNAGDEVCEILSTDQLELKVKVLESDINAIRIGQKAEVFPVTGGQEGLTGTVSSINPKVDENGLVQVTIQLSRAGNLLSGMNARAVIRSPQNNSTVVPKQALVYRSGRPVVFTIENNESRWNYVEVGKDNGKEVEILDGISPNSTVIVSNNLQLAHQAPVQIVKE